MNALDDVNVRQMVDRVKQEAMKFLSGPNFTVAAPEDNRRFLQDMYNLLGMDTRVEFARKRTQEPVFETLPAAADGTVQIGDGEGPEVVTGYKTIETEDTNNLSILIRVPNAVEMINLDVKIS